MRRVLHLVMALMLLGRIGTSAARREHDVLEDTFQWVPGAWAEYELIQGATNAPVRFRMAITGLDTSTVPSEAWVEVGIGPTNGAMLVTRMKVEVANSGPGEPLEAVMQFPGSDPIAVPRKHLKSGKTSGTAASRWTSTAVHPTWSNITWMGRELIATEITATNSTGARSRVLVSSNAPPLCIVSACSSNREMRLVEWGSDAKSAIIGEPVGLMRWIWRQVRGGTPNKVHAESP
jgi:hypothetical protein